MECFALLDDCAATPADPRSRLYTGFVREHRCTDAAGLDALCAAAQADLHAGLHAVVLADYEWGACLQGVVTPTDSEAPAALRLLMFSRLQDLSAEAVTAWLAQRGAEGAPAGACGVRPSVGRQAFDEAIARIHAAIQAGETYQVNYTYRLDFQAFGDPVALYRRLRAAQPVSFGALIALPPGAGQAQPAYILSCSPELFVQHRQGRLSARPMKGTAPRGETPEADAAAAQALCADPKNRAENLMIVDLLRNDLGAVARIGSVAVPSLFAVERYPSVLQMTSTVTAERRADAGFADILRALFPCGSITGAPKRNTMEWIARLEGLPRGLYTGAIGWLDAPADAGAACGDFCLSVAIRTLALHQPAGTTQCVASDVGAGGNTDDPGGVDDTRTPYRDEWLGRMGVGGGIVIDSEAAGEYAETQLKAGFLTNLDPGFSLFETMRVTCPPAAIPCIPLLEHHLVRLRASAEELGFRFDGEALERALARQLATLVDAERAQGAGEWRMRLDLNKHGKMRFDVTSLQHGDAPPSALHWPCSPDALPAVGEESLVWLASRPATVPSRLWRHKTSWRPFYDTALHEAMARGGFDILFFNEAGELCEGARSNVFLCLNGEWLTPPLHSGLLPGVMRRVLLAAPAWRAREAVLKRDDVLRAERLVVCNALRGVVPVRLAGAITG